MLERLHLRPEISAFEAFLRERVAFSSTIEDVRFARVRAIERGPRGSLTVVSQFIAGNRLCDLLEAATGLPAHEATCPSVDAALGFLLEILPALGTLHDNGGYGHGTLGPGRIVLTPESHVVMLDWLYGPIVDRLQISRRSLWLDLGVASLVKPERSNVAADLSQTSLTAMMIVLGRPLRKNEYPDGIAPLLNEVSEIAQIRGSSDFAASLEGYLRRTLPLAEAQPHANAADAAAEVRHVAREIGVSRCRAALAAFVEDMNRLLAEERGLDLPEPVVSESELEESPLDELTAGFARVSEISLDDLSLTTADPALEEAASHLLAPHWDAEPDPVPAVYTDPTPAHEDIAVSDVPLATTPAPVQVSPEPVEELEPVVVPPVLSLAPAITPVAAPEPPKPIAVEPPIAVAEPAPTPRLETEVFPEPAITPEREPKSTTGFQFLDPGEPVAPKAVESKVPQAVEVESVTLPAAAPTPTPATPAPAAKQSNRKRRGLKGQRDKLRSNAVPPPQPAPLRMPPTPVPIPMPTFSRGPEPVRHEAPPPAPLAVRPPEPPKAPAPLRLKADGPSGFNAPAPRVERREPAPAPIPRFLEREEPATTGQFPWKLVAAAAVAIVAVIGVGRAYIPGHNTPPETEATEPAPAPAPAATKKVEATKPGSLAVTTQPAGAHVMLDGKDVGESPVLLDSVTAGKHTLTFITTSGTVKKTIRMEAGKPLSVDVPIYSGWIAVFSPVTLDIAENGKSIGTTEQGRLMLSPGRHVLTFTNRDMGYKTTQSVDIEPGEERSVSLVPTGELSANATPWAEVWLDGKKIGDTPLAGQHVPLGTHEVVFKNPQFPERRVTVTVTASNPVTASVDFTKQ